jgi:hypothetical protein
METLLVNIASSGNLPQDALKEVLNKDEEGSDTSSHFSERLSETTSPSVSYDPQSSPTVDKSERILPRPRGAECLDVLHNKNKPLSYVGSSSGIYLLSKLLPKDGTNGLPATLPKGLDSDENDLLVARFDHDNDKKLGFCLSKQPEWELPCKEIQDYLINM